MKKKTSDQPIRPVTKEEILEATRKVGKSKSLGLDGIPNVALRKAIEPAPEMYDRCMQKGIFPHRWKQQKFILDRTERRFVLPPTVHDTHTVRKDF